MRTDCGVRATAVGWGSEDPPRVKTTSCVASYVSAALTALILKDSCTARKTGADRLHVAVPGTCQHDGWQPTGT